MFKSLLLGTFVLSLLSFDVAAAAAANRPEDLAGTWDLALGSAGMNCRVLLRPQKSDKGDYFLGLPPACRHSMPVLATAGRWSMPDPRHITLADPAGAPVLAFAGSGEAFAASSGTLTYTLKPVALTGRSSVGFVPAEVAPTATGFAPIELVANRHRRTTEASGEAAPSVGDIAGRYAVMREKRDTGCMLTLDTARVAGGERAQLAPGCRDQGIVVFDPMAWQMIKGELVLTARAGHKAHLGKAGEGAWTKDPKDGKPLGLKKL